ncbi:MAG: hypothetical protein V4556_08450 [Bacteroidota bacterium]
MTKILFILSFLLFNTVTNAQTIPNVKMVSKSFISGMGEAKDTIYVSTANTSTSDYWTTVDENGKFKINFTTNLTVGNPIKVWSEKNDVISLEISTLVQTDDQIIALLQAPTKTDPPALVNKLKKENYDLRNTKLWYTAKIITTNFTIPMARFNLVKDNATKKGDILLFSSIGAGVGVTGGRMQVIRDNQGNIVSEEFSNSLGIFAGFLFSAGSGEESKNVFAPTLSLCFLDFQLGIGRELGDITPTQRRTFYTLAYSIPLYKLVTKGYRIISWGDPYHSE